MYRIQPNMTAAEYKTFEISAPIQTHFREGTCAEVDCSHHINGWHSLIDERTELGQKQAHYIRKQSGRKFKETRDPTGITRFWFEAGQKCFRQHKVSLERPAIFLVRDGDFRGNPRGTAPRIHTSAESWRDNFAEHQDNIATLIQRG